jgi:hypothetical protein
VPNCSELEVACHQCFTNSVVFLIAHLELTESNKKSHNWNATQISAVLEEGTDLFVQTYLLLKKERVKVEANGHLEPNHFAVYESVGIKVFGKHWDLDMGDDTSFVISEQEIPGFSYSITDGLRELFVTRKHSGAILLTGGKAFAVACNMKDFVLFDAHPCGISGAPTTEALNGWACVQNCLSLKELEAERQKQKEV